ncbi:DUF2087 domain-containing protein [Microbacterium sp. lyk4-40-TSB-66]|uniref:DUF2087 domain-containing protein n=1 Tax=Microbacterium sp. lyk4-40-TSB-66 TaxID=3040294 RepID=UPI00255140B7|nr:DUF2087 domain-containing protein [Microbacterium sp. lyk4-40-TSB-66]
MSANSWRPLVAALADDRAREIYALVVLGRSVDEHLSTLSPGKRRRVLDSLQVAGLISPVDGGWRAESEVFRLALAAASTPVRPDGVARFFTDGRLPTYPSRAADRREVLAHIATRILGPDETLTEAEVTDWLAEITGDPVSMRRYLVDAGFLVRTRDGSAYCSAS